MIYQITEEMSESEILNEIDKIESSVTVLNRICLNFKHNVLSKRGWDIRTYKTPLLNSFIVDYFYVKGEESFMCPDEALDFDK